MEREFVSVAKDSIVKGKVSGITKFGAFVKLENGMEGLVHISEIADTYVKNINDYLKLGDEIAVKVLGQNKQGKLDLSLKKATTSTEGAIEVVRLEHREEKGGAEERENSIEEHEPVRFAPRKKKNTIEDPFEAKMSAFLKKSEEKLLDLKRNVQEKQGYKKRKRT